MKNKTNNIMQDIAKIFDSINLDGGKGSGNFGHSGRPGKLGGAAQEESTNNPPDKKKYGINRIESPSEVSAYKSMKGDVKKIYDKLLESEQKTTQQLEKAFLSNKMQMVGEKFAVKQPKSLQRKINDVMKDKNIDEKSAINSLNDILRYTAVSSSKDLVKGATKTLNELKQKGHRVLNIKNTWMNDESVYKGVNIKMQDEGGNKYELQFHTPQSFDMKERKQYKYYELSRSKTTSEEDKRGTMK